MGENVAENAKRVMQLPLGGMDLASTLFCGQCFSWRPCGEGSFVGVAGERAARVWQQGPVLFVEKLDDGPAGAAEEAFWRNYFALDVDYAALHARFAEDEVLRQCVEACPGVRVLRQPFFDTLLSFIISQNNHVPRITGIVQRLCQGFGRPLAQGLYAFPAPEALSTLSVEELDVLRAGFRAKYLIDAAQKVAGGVVDETALRKMGDDEARETLRLIRGVGPKVADCVLLFALGRDDVAPMDVWMKRAVERYFGGSMPGCAAGAAGIAQQYIFHWMRMEDGRA